MRFRTRATAALGAALLLVPPLYADDKPAAPPVTAPATSTAAPRPTGLTFNGFNKMAWFFTKGNVLKSAEKMPEENYGFKPVDSIRSFGQVVGHVADSSYYFCSAVAGEKNASKQIEKTKTTKADLIAALKESFAYCDKVFETLTPEHGAEMVSLFGGQQIPKVDALTATCMHGVEHYGNMIVYLRMKGIVPPSTEQMQAAAAAAKPQK